MHFHDRHVVPKMAISSCTNDYSDMLHTHTCISLADESLDTGVSTVTPKEAAVGEDEEDDENIKQVRAKVW